MPGCQWVRSVAITTAVASAGWNAELKSASKVINYDPKASKGKKGSIY